MKGYSPIMAVQSMTGVSTRLAYSRERSNQKKKEQEKEQEQESKSTPSGPLRKVKMQS